MPQAEGTWFDHDTGDGIIRVVHEPGEETQLISLSPAVGCRYKAMFYAGTPDAVIIAAVRAALRLPPDARTQPPRAAPMRGRPPGTRGRWVPPAERQAAMTIDELIELASEAREDLGGDAEVRIASQPGWPLRAALACVTIPHSTDPSDLYGPDETAAGQEKDGTFLWLATGDLPDGENPYAPEWAWRDSYLT